MLVAMESRPKAAPFDSNVSGERVVWAAKEASGGLMLPLGQLLPQELRLILLPAKAIHPLTGSDG